MAIRAPDGANNCSVSSSKDSFGFLLLFKEGISIKTEHLKMIYNFLQKILEIDT